ncbi:uncharacterized protein LOC133308046 isoform X2 [Gastrolobium bilobum]|uniref:uncharacterized protein LOC133308046 isoform X2 n=1 Tax=Gastrolobium bilobum TaxID=150636 RepID=UPI002AAF2B0B|nr:uncharacterized protein LOC133308046 isoform X2 [Gastrolobium bilobum]
MNQMSSRIGIGIVCGGNSGTNYMVPLSLSLPSSSFSSLASLPFNSFIKGNGLVLHNWTPSNHNNGYERRKGHGIVASSDVASPSTWDDWKPPKASSTPSLSDILWPSVGAFAAMALLGKLDQLLAPKGLSISIAPLGAVCALLFTTPSAPAARNYSMFMAQIGCAAIGVLAFTIFGPGWLAKCASVSACVAYMIYTSSIHPPGCILLSLMKEVVVYLKNNFKF